LFGELVQLYRFLANLSREVQQNEEGVIIRDDVGKPVIETKVFSIDPELESALSAMKGSDLRGAIAQQIVRIRLSSSDAIDLSLHLDPGGGIRQQLDTLWADCVFALESVLRRKDIGKPQDRYNELIESLKKADESRRTARQVVLKHR
jgi:hypothetical protein